MNVPARPLVVETVAPVDIMRFLRAVKRFVEHLATAMFAAMFLMFIIGVGMRYIVGKPLSWSDEVAIILLLWSMFLASAFVLRDKDHVTLDLLYGALPPAGQRVIAFIAAAGFGLLFVAVTPGTYDLVAFLTRERTPGLQLRLDHVYSCFVVFIGAIGVRLLWKAVQLLRSRWREEL